MDFKSSSPDETVSPANDKDSSNVDESFFGFLPDYTENELDTQCPSHLDTKDDDNINTSTGNGKHILPSSLSILPPVLPKSSQPPLLPTPSTHSSLMTINKPYCNYTVPTHLNFNSACKNTKKTKKNKQHVIDVTLLDNGYVNWQDFMRFVMPQLGKRHKKLKIVTEQYN